MALKLSLKNFFSLILFLSLITVGLFFLATYNNIKIDDKYLSGLEHGFDLDKRYDNFDELPKEYLEKMNLLITEQLDTYTNLKTI